MPAMTLKELTLQLSRDLSTHHKDCLLRMEHVEAERTGALQALPGAAAVLAAATRARADAAVTRESTLFQIGAELERTERKASTAREAAVRAVEKKFRDGSAAASRAKQDAEDKARGDLKAELAKIEATVRLSEQGAPRRAAERRFEEARQTAHDAFLRAIDINKERQLGEHHTALNKEFHGSRAAREDAAFAREAAEQVFQRALKAAETRMRRELQAVNGADAVQAQFDEQRERAKLGCRQREEELFAAFRKAKEALG